MSLRESQSKVAQNGRKKPLKDTEELVVTVPLRDRIQKELLRKLEDLREGHRTIEIWNAANAQRAPWLERQVTFLSEYDEFLNPIYKPTSSWSSTLHLPIALTVAKTFHARMNAALLGVDPPFTVKARQSANQERSMLIQELMRYVIRSWANQYQGVEEAADAWIWHWITRGSAVLKTRWDRQFTRYVDVVKQERVESVTMATDPETGATVPFPQMVTEEIEQEVTKETFNGPCVEEVPMEDIVIVGGGGDPQRADDVIQSIYMTESELWQLADQGYFKREAVEEILKSGKNYKASEAANAIKVVQASMSGTGDLDKHYDLPRYQILERYGRVDVDGSGITSEVVMWVHKETGIMARAAYLYRVRPSGRRPFHKIDFHKRHGQDYGVGLIELLYTLTKEIDAVHNMKIDFGLISSMPFGFYRPTSSLAEERMPVEPGVMIPLDNPQADVFFPNLGSRTSFTVQEEQALMQQIERLTSVSDLSLGIVGGQGATRTATGTRALLGESNANLDIFLRRMNRGWSSVLVDLFHMLQDKLPAGFQFRILGDDGSMYWETVKSKEELCGMYDFELEPNSANSNKSIQIEQANAILQTIANPLFMQLGVVDPANLFQALKNKFQVEGVRDWARYIRKPQGALRVYSPEEIANAALHGVDIKLGPEQDLQGFLDFWQHIYDNDELLGQFSEQQTVALYRKVQEAEAMMQAVQAQQAQVANNQQVAMNAALTTPTPQSSGQQQAAQPGASGANAAAEG